MAPAWDFIIIGQGIAGSLLASALREHGQRVLIVDDGYRSAASTVAAGLINPLAGMRFNRPDQIDAWLGQATTTYATWADRIGHRLWHELPMLRLFRSPEQVRFYDRRLQDRHAVSLLGARFAPGKSGEDIADPHGGFIQRQTGYVDIPPLLRAVRQEWIAENGYRETGIEYSEITPRTDRVCWRDTAASHLVFCEGFRVRHNPWFDWLSMAPDKGEILDIEAADGMPGSIVNGAHWLIPVAGGRYRFGSTHEHHTLTNTPTPAARENLLRGFTQLLPGREPRVTRHQAGIRPATRDRKPMIGRHPHHSRLHVFNGFGARGCLTIPWYAARFAEHLLCDADLPAEANIARDAP